MSTQLPADITEHDLSVGQGLPGVAGSCPASFCCENCGNLITETDSQNEGLIETNLYAYTDTGAVCTDCGEREE